MQIKVATILALLPFLVAASPTPVESGITVPLHKRNVIVRNGVVDTDALRAHVDHVHAKIQRGFDNYEKNTGSKHPNWVQGAVQKRASTGKVTLTDEQEELWQGNIKVGTPAVTFSIDFDTGSSDLFLPSSNCGSSCSGHTKYNPSKSNTAKDAKKKFSLAYGDGSTVSGEQYTDTVNFGGLIATKQRLGAASTYSGFESSRFPPDGLMGMAFQSISEYNSPPVFQTLVAQGKVAEPVFGFTLLKFGSELYLGGVDNSKFDGSLTYAPVTQQGYWQISLDGASVGSNSVFSSGVEAIVDTGTTLIIGDTSNVASIYAAIPGSKDASSTLGSGTYTIPCDSVPDNVSFTIAGKDFSISADNFSLGPASDGSSDCVGGILGDDSLGFWILGDVFLRNVYTSFDVGNEQVGFAAIS